MSLWGFFNGTVPEPKEDEQNNEDSRSPPSPLLIPATPATPASSTANVEESNRFAREAEAMREKQRSRGRCGACTGNVEDLCADGDDDEMIDIVQSVPVLRPKSDNSLNTHPAMMSPTVRSPTARSQPSPTARSQTSCAPEYDSFFLLLDETGEQEQSRPLSKAAKSSLGGNPSEKKSSRGFNESGVWTIWSDLAVGDRVRSISSLDIGRVVDVKNGRVAIFFDGDEEGEALEYGATEFEVWRSMKKKMTLSSAEAKSQADVETEEQNVRSFAKKSQHLDPEEFGAECEDIKQVWRNKIDSARASTQKT